MRVAYVGLGKLGFPCALAAATRHDVVGYDASPAAAEVLTTRRYPHREVGAQRLLETTNMRVVRTLDEAVTHADLVFVAVQTPHSPEYEGVTRMPEARADFDYTALRQAVSGVAAAAERLKKKIALAVISTVLPGTSRREVLPLLNAHVDYVYNPFFIAMGTTVVDFLRPEFVLLGCDDPDGTGLALVERFYEELHEHHARLGRGYRDAAVCDVLGPARRVVMSVTSAELTKVSYNVFLGLKIAAANAVMEIAHKTGADCDDVTDALMLATDRVVSPRYMRGGGGDSGACHPRDQIALSWLAQKLDLSYDLFGSMVRSREAQTWWLARLCVDEARACRLREVVVLGKAYKAGTNLTIGSYATLLVNLLREHAWVQAGGTVSQWDPHVDPPRTFSEPAAFLVATNHVEFYAPEFTQTIPAGSVVVDPWGKMLDLPGCRVVRVGRASRQK